MHLVRPDISIDFVGKRYIAGAVSAVLVVLSLGLFFFVGPNWGIDFTGGTEIHLDFEDPIEISEVRGALGRLGLGEDAVQQIGTAEDGEYVVRIQDPTFGTGGLEEEVTGALHSEFGADWISESKFDVEVGARITVRYNGNPVTIEQVQQAVSVIQGAQAQEAPDDNTIYIRVPGLSAKIESVIQSTLPDRGFKVLRVDSVGPKVGGELRQQGLLAIGITLILVLVYVAFRFDLAFAPGAVLALFHDVSLVVGVFTLTGHEFNLPMIGALLTIIGYSLNDTIVIYDRIRENMTRYRRKDLPNLVNVSVNETLGRTLATSMTTMMAMTAFLFLGGPVIETFALAIMMGVIFGTYSTVYVASPTILLMQDVKPVLTRIFAPLAVKDGGNDDGKPAAGGAQTRAEQRRLERKERREQATKGA